jgi:hypothetical protein
MVDVASIALLNWYLSANVLVIVAVLLLAGIDAISLRLPQPFAYRHLLQLGYAISAAAVLLPFIGWISGHERVVPHSLQVWSASTMRGPILAATADQRITLSLARTGASMSFSLAARFASGVFVSGLLVVLARVAMDALAIAKIIARAQLLHRRGCWRMLTSETVGVPFSFWIPGHYFIIVPTQLILRPYELRSAAPSTGGYQAPVSLPACERTVLLESGRAHAGAADSRVAGVCVRRSGRRAQAALRARILPLLIVGR